MAEFKANTTGPSILSDLMGLYHMTILNEHFESNEQFERRRKYHKSKRYSVLSVLKRIDNPIASFKFSFICDCDQSNSSGSKYGCDVCDQTGVVSYYCNSEPNEQCILGFENRNIKN